MISRLAVGLHVEVSTTAGSDEDAEMERELVAAARRGDENAFRSLMEPRRAELYAHCYRMLGSAQDAEDVVQDALFRAWRGLARFEGRSSVRTWLYRVTTNACLDALGRRSHPVPIGVGPGTSAERAVEASGPVPLWLEPYPEPLEIEDARSDPEARYEQRESVELAFVVALEYLAPNERAVLLLRDVLGFSAREMSELLDTTTGAVNSALQRARGRVEGGLPRPSQQDVQRSLGDGRVREIVERYMDAMGRGDVGAVVEMLTADATWAMPPFPSWYQGPEQIAQFLERGPFQFRWRHTPTRANGQPAVAGYAWDDELGCFAAHALDVLTLQGTRIAAVTGFVDPVHIERFGLPSVWLGDR